MADGEKGSNPPKQIPHFRQVYDQGAVTDDVINHEYEGSGTEDDPYIVVWLDKCDPRNPQLYPMWKKWSLTVLVAWATLCVAFSSSAYSGGVKQIIEDFGCSEEIAILGISLFVLGFALGPLIWAPMSELYGRQKVFIYTYAMFAAFNGAAAASQNIQTLIILRFFAGAVGSSPLTNAGGVIADTFSAAQRGSAMVLFASAPFLGPAIGPIVGGFVGETIGWRWIEGIMGIFTATLGVLGAFLIPETYAPVLLRQRARRLSKINGHVYKSRSDAEQGVVTAATAFKTSLSRPWVLLIFEPIVLLLTIYMAIIYGTLYMLFAAFPIVYQEGRHWTEGIGGLAFLGIAIGMIIGMAYALWDNKRYIRVMNKSPGRIAPPEARLPPTMVGAGAITIGLFWFAWTNSPSLPWAASVAAQIPFGFGMVLIFLSVMNYLIDAYLIFAASVLAANSVLRSLFGCIFPLFTTYMYNNLGIHWASSIPAFLALACVPFPFAFYKYGPAIRRRCKFAAEADEFLQKLRSNADEKASERTIPTRESSPSSAEKDIEKGAVPADAEEEKVAEPFDYSYEDDNRNSAEGGRFESIVTGTNQAQKADAPISYEHSPFDLDRVNTKKSFSSLRSNNKSTSTLGRARSTSRVTSNVNSRAASKSSRGSAA